MFNKKKAAKHITNWYFIVKKKNPFQKKIDQNGLFISRFKTDTFPRGTLKEMEIQLLGAIRGIRSLINYVRATHQDIFF